jgi:hypothetical protein
MSLDKGDNNSKDNPKETPKLANLKVAEVAEQRDVGRKYCCNSCNAENSSFLNSLTYITGN